MALMCPVGFLLGYGFAKVVIGADAKTARTVSMETGIQQVGIAGAIAIQTFKGQALDKAIATIAVFGIFTVVCFSVSMRAVAAMAFRPTRRSLRTGTRSSRN